MKLRCVSVWCVHILIYEARFSSGFVLFYKRKSGDKMQNQNRIPNFFEWCDEYATTFGCDIETAQREYYYQFYPENYNAEDYEEEI